MAMTVDLASLRIPAGLEFHSARSSGPPLGRFLCDQRAPSKPLWPNPPGGGLTRDSPFAASNDLFRGAEDALAMVGLTREPPSGASNDLFRGAEAAPGELLKPWEVSLGTLLLLLATICFEAQRSRQRLLQSEALWRRRPRRVAVSNSLCIACA